MSPASPAARLFFSLIVALGLLGTATLAEAQSSGFGEPLGHLYFSAEPTSYDPNITAPSFVPFTVYLVADLDYADIGREELNSNSGIAAFEMDMQLPGLGSDFLVLSARIRNVAVNIGDQTNVIVGINPPVLAAQTPIDLVEYTFLSVSPTVPTDARIEAGPASPSSFSPATPGWAESADIGECTNPVSGAPTKCLRAFAEVSPAVINPTGSLDPSLVVVIPEAEVPSEGATRVTIDAQLGEIVPVGKADPSDLAGLDLELSWDAALAELTDVRTTEATAGWSLESNVGQGSVRISAANVNGLQLDTDLTSILELEFTSLGQTGSTAVVADAFSFFDSSPSRIENVQVVNGAIFVIPCERYDPLDDDVINSGDAIVALQIVTGQIFPTNEAYCSADTDGDGIVDTGDVIRILRRAVGLEKSADLSNVAARTGIEAQGATVRLRLEGAAGLQGALHYDAEVLHSVDVTGADDVLVSVHREEAGVIRFAVASTEALDDELLLRFEPISASSAVGVVRLDEVRGFDATGEPLEVERDGSEVSLRLGTPEVRGTRLLAAVPNPFNPRTEIRLHLERPSDLRLRIYDTAGREVRNLDRRGLSAGDHAVQWNGLDDQGRRAASGVYFVRMQADGMEQGLRVVLLK